MRYVYDGLPDGETILRVISFSTLQLDDNDADK